MSASHDDLFCRHCGVKLPAFGAGVGFCPPCGKRLGRSAGAAMGPTPIDRYAQTSEFVKDPLLATVLSAVFPGGGQVYNGHFLKGLLVLVTSPFVIPWLIGIVDAFFSAKRHNRQRDDQLVAMAQAA